MTQTRRNNTDYQEMIKRFVAFVNSLSLVPEDNSSKTYENDEFKITVYSSNGSFRSEAWFKEEKNRNLKIIIHCKLGHCAYNGFEIRDAFGWLETIEVSEFTGNLAVLAKGSY